MLFKFCIYARQTDNHIKPNNNNNEKLFDGPLSRTTRVSQQQNSQKQCINTPIHHLRCPQIPHKHSKPSPSGLTMTSRRSKVQSMYTQYLSFPKQLQPACCT